MSFQAYTPDEVPFGTPFIVTSRFTFDEDRIIALAHALFGGIPDDIKALFHVY